MDPADQDVAQTATPEHAHESTDVNLRALALFGVAMIVGAAVLHIVLWGVYSRFEAEERLGENPQPRFVERGGDPDVPVLQPDPHEDLVRLREDEREVIDGYGWVDRGAGIVRIPVDRAIDLVAERGLPRASRKGQEGAR